MPHEPSTEMGPEPGVEPDPKPDLERKPRTRRTAEQTRGLILSAAAALFAERGYLGTSLGDVAERSGVAKSNILYFYKNKDELWKDAVDHVFEAIHSLVDVPALQEFEPTWALFEGLLREHVLTCARHPAFIKIPLIEGSQRSWRTDWLAERHIKRSVAWFREFLQPFVNVGMVPDGKAFELQTLLSGGAQLLYSQEALFSAVLGRDRLDEAFAADYARFVVGLLKKAAGADAHEP